ncbi:MAG TPA: GxxExxY protein [Chthoniobacterales bacterium]|nr:GxxExxY protein [Chthoniobacterales bacterium]
MELIYRDESYAIVGACMNVYKEKGCGFLEPVYHECLEIEFSFQQIPFLSSPRKLRPLSRNRIRTSSSEETRTCRWASLKFSRLFVCFVGNNK